MARRVAALAAFVAVVAALTAHAAALHTAEVETDGGPVTVEQGGAGTTYLALSASGAISCTTGHEDPPATVTFDSSYALDSEGAVSSSEPAVIPFMSDAASRGGSSNCTPTWEGAPDPFIQPIRVSADRGTPLGDYEIPVDQEIRNSPDTGSSGKLGGSPASVHVRVVRAQPRPQPEPQREQQPDPVEIAEEQLVLGEQIAPLRPKLGRSFVLSPVSGVVLLRTGGRTVPLTADVEVPTGAAIDATRGVVKITVESDRAGTLQSAEVWGGAFKPRQGRAAAPLTVFRLSGILRPRRAGALRANAAAVRRRKLWAKGRGRFSSRGRRASAIVRGTEWMVADTAAGTRVRVRTGTVRVRDFTTRRQIVLRAGQSYLARERRATARRAPAFTGRVR